MKCQNCGKNEVNFHYSSNINGTVTERHLCSDCARQLGYSRGPSSSIFNEIDRFFTGRFSQPVDFPEALGFVAPVLFAAPSHLGILIQNNHPGAHYAHTAAPAHIPEQDAKIDADMSKQREINVVREQLRQAVEREDYEKAIELREEIKKLEGKI